MAVGEAITNLCAAPVESLDRIKLSANWMAAAGHPGEDARLFDAVRAVGMELCPDIDLSIPVGKDSLSMQAQWQDGGAAHRSVRSEEHTSELQSLMRISYAVFCLKKKKNINTDPLHDHLVLITLTTSSSKTTKPPPSITQ